MAPAVSRCRRSISASSPEGDARLRVRIGACAWCRRSDQPPGGALFRCADLEGTYGRTAVTSTSCVGAAGGIAAPARLHAAA